MADESKKTMFRKAVVAPPEEIKKKFLVGNTAPYIGKPFEIDKETYTIGREEGRDLVIVSEMVSRHHASIIRQGDKVSILDNNSSNGTLLNNKQLEPEKQVTLNHKDILKFDQYEFIFVDSAQADLWETLKPLNRAGAQIIALYSPKGGAGLSSITVNLASSIAQASGKKVAVADFNFAFGDVLAYSSGRAGLSIADLMRDANITGEMIEKFLQKGPGFNFLAAPTKMEEAELANDWGTKKADTIQKILWSLEAKHDFVLVDLRNQIDEISLTTWEMANVILLVGRPEVAHMLALKKIISTMDKLKYPETKVKVLINRMGSEGALNAEQIESFLKRKFFTLPEALSDAMSTVQGGKLYVTENAASPLSQAVSNLARSLRGEEVVAQVEGGLFGKLKALLGM